MIAVLAALAAIFAPIDGQSGKPPVAELEIRFERLKMEPIRLSYEATIKNVSKETLRCYRACAAITRIVPASKYPSLPQNVIYDWSYSTDMSKVLEPGKSFRREEYADIDVIKRITVDRIRFRLVYSDKYARDFLEERMGPPRFANVRIVSGVFVYDKKTGKVWAEKPAAPSGLWEGWGNIYPGLRPSL